jgi:hypothetical protein
MEIRYFRRHTGYLRMSAVSIGVQDRVTKHEILATQCCRIVVHGGGFARMQGWMYR